MTSAARDVLLRDGQAAARRLLWRYRRELLGPRWFLLTALSWCPAPVLRVVRRLKSLIRVGSLA